MTSMATNLVFKGIENYTAPQSTSSVQGQKSTNVFDNLNNNWGLDEFVPQSKPAQNTETTEAPKIGTARVLFSRLTQEQIDAVNKSKQLPKNAKFKGDIPRLAWNLIDFTKGTHKLPVGYELKKDILGFTHVVREDSKAWYLKKS